jgi:hypothetical protein
MIGSVNRCVLCAKTKKTYKNCVDAVLQLAWRMAYVYFRDRLCSHLYGRNEKCTVIFLIIPDNVISPRYSVKRMYNS